MVLIFYGEAVLLATVVLQASFVLFATGIGILFLCFELNNQFQALVDSKMVLLPSIRSIPTASAVRYYTEMQAFRRLLWFPLILSANLVLLLLSLCNGDRSRKIDA